MRPSEAALVVAKLAAVDNRAESEAAAIAWADALDPAITLPDALDAVTLHRRRSTDWCQPAHINAIVKEIRRDRLAHAGVPPLPHGLTQGEERAWLHAWRTAAADGQTNPTAIANHTLQSHQARQLEGATA